MTVPVMGGTTATDRTDSMNEVLRTLRAALLEYTNDNGDSARDSLEERLFQGRAPDETLVFPYAVMRLNTSNDGRNHGLRLTGTLEVQVYGKPWSMQEAVNDVADLFDQAMLTLLRVHQGLIFCHGNTRAPLPPAGAPVDGEVITIRLTYTLAIWPAFLTARTRVLPPLG